MMASGSQAALLPALAACPRRMPAGEGPRRIPHARQRDRVGHAGRPRQGGAQSVRTAPVPQARASCPIRVSALPLTLPVAPRRAPGPQPAPPPPGSRSPSNAWPESDFRRHAGSHPRRHAAAGNELRDRHARPGRVGRAGCQDAANRSTCLDTEIRPPATPAGTRRGERRLTVRKERLMFSKTLGSCPPTWRSTWAPRTRLST